MKTLPVVLQLYSVRDYLDKDLLTTLKAIKEMGYDYVETAGLYGCTFKEFAGYLTDAGLKAVSAHVGYSELLNNTEESINNYISIGCKYIAVPFLSPELRPGTDKFFDVVKSFEKIGRVCAEKGVTLLYHNHAFEFTKVENGVYALDYIYETISEKYLQTELDTCWINVGGENPAEYISKYKNRCPVVHLKDFAGNIADNSFKFRPLGQGVQNMPSILAAAQISGAEWVVVEQDEPFSDSSLQEAKISRDYLKSLGW